MIARVGSHSLGAQRANLSLGVLALERSQIDHPDGEVQSPQLRLLLDRACLEFGDPFIDADLIDTAYALHDRLNPVRAPDPRANERARLPFGSGVMSWFGYVCHVPILRPIVALNQISSILPLTQDRKCVTLRSHDTQARAAS